jgi:hypothetical protein
MHDSSENLDAAIESFHHLQSELNYERARSTLKEVLERLDLSQRERYGLEAEIGELHTMLSKLDRSVFQVAAFGMVGRGKSSLLNALIGQEAFTTGAIHGVTRDRSQVTWEITNWDEEWDFDNDNPSTYQKQIEFIDTPGIDEVGGKARQELAQEVARQVDLILFVIAGDLTELELQTLAQLQLAGKPLLLVFNQIDRYPDRDREAIYAKICDERVKELLTADDIILVAAAPMVAQAHPQEDGSIGVIRRRSSPQIAPLRRKIIEIIQSEGKSLAALNAMLATDRIHQQLIDRKMSRREEAANDIIWQSVMGKAIAIALNPVTAADLVAGAALDVAMILRLSQLYGIPMTRSSALSLLQNIALGMGGIATSEFLTNLGLSGIKGLLALLTPATGGMSVAPYTAVALTQASIAGLSSYSIGQVTKTYLANGASWGDNSPKTVINRILATIDEDSIVNRIKKQLTINN